MGTLDIRTQHQPTLEHHVQQGDVWLAAGAGGENTAALSYAALEYRFAIERLGLHYLGTLLLREGHRYGLRTFPWRQALISDERRFVGKLFRNEPIFRVDGPTHDVRVPRVRMGGRLNVQSLGQNC